MKNDFQTICALPEHEYIFSTSGGIREASAAIIARKRNDEKNELGLALIDINQNILYYMESNKLIQLYRAMEILDEFYVITESALMSAFIIASRQFTDRTKMIINHLEKGGMDVMSIQGEVFSHEIGRNEFKRIMEKIRQLNIEIEDDELVEERKIRYIPDTTRFMKKSFAAG